MASNVRCADCGFLAIWNTQTDEVLPAPSWLRRDDLLADPSHPTQVRGKLPTCFAQRAYLERQLDAWGKEHGSPLEVRNVKRGVGSDGWIVQMHESVHQALPECEGFTTYKLGATPKEHREMMDRQWAAEREDRRDQAQRDWQTSQERKNRDTIIWSALLGAFFAGLFTLVAVLFQLVLTANNKPIVNNYIQAPISQPSAPQSAPSNGEPFVLLSLLVPATFHCLPWAEQLQAAQTLVEEAVRVQNQ